MVTKRRAAASRAAPKSKAAPKASKAKAAPKKKRKTVAPPLETLRELGRGEGKALDPEDARDLVAAVQDQLAEKRGVASEKTKPPFQNKPAATGDRGGQPGTI